jgi:hypothetical protein
MAAATFYNGVICTKHPELQGKRYVIRKSCQGCDREARHDHYLRNRERVLAQGRIWRERNRERVKYLQDQWKIRRMLDGIERELRTAT